MSDIDTLIDRAKAKAGQDGFILFLKDGELVAEFYAGDSGTWKPEEGGEYTYVMRGGLSGKPDVAIDVPPFDGIVTGGLGGVGGGTGDSMPRICGCSGGGVGSGGRFDNGGGS